MCYLVCVSGPVSSSAGIAEKENSFVGKLGFGLITTAVKPGPNISPQRAGIEQIYLYKYKYKYIQIQIHKNTNISLERAGIEQNRKGNPAQIVIGLQSKKNSTFKVDLFFISTVRCSTDGPTQR